MRLGLLMSLLLLLARDGEYQKPPREVQAYCALAFAPSQVVRYAELEAIYCNGTYEGQCVGKPGWIVVSDPVRCD